MIDAWRIIVPIFVFCIAVSWPVNADLNTTHSLPAVRHGYVSNIKLGPLQKQIDALKQGETLYLKNKTYLGPIVIKKPHVKIVGSNGAKISGGYSGSVIAIMASGVSLENLSVIHSGKSPVTIDSGITIQKTNDVTIQNIKITDCLFGIDVQLSHNITLQNNFISSKNFEIGQRGDAIRLWNSSHVDVLNNHWEDSRDAVAWYSKNVTFKKNTATRSRYSIHTMYSKQVSINGNEFHANSVGIFLMYGSDFTIVRNKIYRSTGPTGMGIGLKDSSNIFIQDNQIFYSTTGLLVDSSPFNPASRNWVTGNKFANNLRAIVLNNDQPGGEFKNNVFMSNLQDVISENRRPSRGGWSGNFWDKYQGFDEDHNDVGDTSHTVYKYGEKILNADPRIDFFYGTFVLALIEFVEKVIHMGKPTVLLIDSKPLLRL